VIESKDHEAKAEGGELPAATKPEETH